MNKDKTFIGQMILAQIIKLIPKQLINSAVQKHDFNKYYKTLPLRTHLISSMFGVLSYCSGLRELCEGMLACEGKLTHLGLVKSPAKSTLTDANTTLTATAQKKFKEYDTLEITGAALLNDKNVRNYSISVYLDGTKIDSLYSKNKKPIKFLVDCNQLYTFLFQKDNCQDKIVIVNTKIPEGLKEMQDHTFDFEIEMSQFLLKDSKETEDFPVAVIVIDKEDELLEASESYDKFTHHEFEVITLNVSGNLSQKPRKSDK